MGPVTTKKFFFELQVDEWLTFFGFKRRETGLTPNYLAPWLIKISQNQLEFQKTEKSNRKTVKLSWNLENRKKISKKIWKYWIWRSLEPLDFVNTVRLIRSHGLFWVDLISRAKTGNTRWLESPLKNQEGSLYWSFCIPPRIHQPKNHFILIETINVESLIRNQQNQVEPAGFWSCSLF